MYLFLRFLDFFVVEELGFSLFDFSEGLGRSI
jgi:hypothetical protein